MTDNLEGKLGRRKKPANTFLLNNEQGIANADGMNNEQGTKNCER